VRECPRNAAFVFVPSSAKPIAAGLDDNMDGDHMMAQINMGVMSVYHSSSFSSRISLTLSNLHSLVLFLSSLLFKALPITASGIRRRPQSGEAGIVYTH
jgi:hypothetical protein